MRCKLGAKTTGVFILFGLITGLNAEMAKAQGAPDFMQTLQNKIQQESQAGLINQQQAVKLQKKEAQIRQKIEKGLHKHGGRLTSDEMHSLAKKAKALNRSVNEQVYKTNRDAVGTVVFQTPNQTAYTMQPNENVNSSFNDSSSQPVLRGGKF